MHNYTANPNMLTQSKWRHSSTDTVRIKATSKVVVVSTQIIRLDHAHIYKLVICKVYMCRHHLSCRGNAIPLHTVCARWHTEHILEACAHDVYILSVKDHLRLNTRHECKILALVLNWTTKAKGKCQNQHLGTTAFLLYFFFNNVAL